MTFARVSRLVGLLCGLTVVGEAVRAALADGAVGGALIALACFPVTWLAWPWVHEGGLLPHVLQSVTVIAFLVPQWIESPPPLREKTTSLAMPFPVDRKRRPRRQPRARWWA